ncbi:calcium-binding protein [Okeania sp. SIO1F9]|uniref:calcium-binding protein n=1 Tax=Okeania sp. SIO1F9 TaxID=2607813 RepID=UPI00144FBBBD|nr:hypothetical protein [Okeania sp. SIO1F9]NET79491.1 hypothetical protein [Okeania sp. SIO1F9]
MADQVVVTWDEVFGPGGSLDSWAPDLTDMGTKNISGSFNNDFQPEAGARSANSRWYYYSKIIGSDTNDTIDGNGDMNATAFPLIDQYANLFSDDPNGFEIKVTQANDDISGGAGEDVIRGHNGDDTLKGNAGNDEIWGNEGNDSILGGGDSDVLRGGLGTDTLKGNAGQDLLYTGLLTGTESDDLHGGANADTFFLGEVPQPQEPEDPGKAKFTGIDWLNLGLSIAGDVSDLAFQYFGWNKLTKEVVPMVFDIGKSIVGGIEDPSAIPTVPLPKTGTYATIKDFNPREDVVFIPLAPTGKANVFISEDTNTTSTLSFKYNSEDGDKTFATLELATPSDIFGQGTNSISRAGQTSIRETLIDNALIIDSNGATQGLYNGTTLPIESKDLENLGSNRFLVLGAYSGLQLEGKGGIDYQYGTNFGDIISGYNLDPNDDIQSDPASVDNDQLRGFNGDDVFLGGAGADIIKGDDGLDTSSYIHSTAGVTVDLTNKPNNTYVEVANDGFGGKDKLYSIENIIGSDYDDEITGDNKPNVLGSAQGDDILTGNGDEDTFILSSGTNTITDFNPSQDKIQIDVKAYYENNQSVDFDATHSDTTNTLTISLAGQDAAILENISNSQVANALQKIEFIGEENNTIVMGDDDNNTGLGGSFSSQYIYGGGGQDGLRALRSKDVLLGGDGDDYLDGSQQADILIGGAGADTFTLYNFAGGYFSGGQWVRNVAPDSIMDFTAAEGDQINILTSHFDGLSSLSDLAYDNNSNELSFNDSVIAILENESGFDPNSHVSLF